MPRSRSTSRPDPPGLPPQAGTELLGLARQSIARELGAARVDHLGADVVIDPGGDAAWLEVHTATFVTLTLDGALRGCIGSLEARRPLREDVEGNARAAALRDPRFAPLTVLELEAVRIETSVLSAISPMDVCDEADALARLRPGVDGVVLSCGGRRSTLLPRVWDHLDDPVAFLAVLKRKAGFPEDFWSEQIRLDRYTVTEFAEE